MSNESPRVSSCILNPVSLAEMYPWQFEDETPDIVKTYFNAVGIMAWLPEEDFEQSLSQRFGSEATDYLENPGTKTYGGKQAASLKSGKLELALAVRSQYDGTRYECYFSWLAAANLPQPSRVLDVGCDFGISTCFYATLFPQATITGIDSCGDAIECARKLAAKLNLTNVEFIEADVRHLPDGLQGQKFDLVFSTFVAPETMGGPPFDDYNVEELLAGDCVDGDGVEYGQALKDLLSNDNAKLVSFEKEWTPHCLASWLRALCEAGVHVPSGNIELLVCFDAEYDGDDTLTVLIGSKRPADPPTAEEIYRLWTGDIDRNKDIYEGLMAEAVLTVTKPKKHCRTLHHAFDDWDQDYETELWACDTQVLIYEHNYDFCKLTRMPAVDPEHTIELLCEVSRDKYPA